MDDVKEPDRKNGDQSTPSHRVVKVERKVAKDRYTLWPEVSQKPEFADLSFAAAACTDRTLTALAGVVERTYPLG